MFFINFSSAKANTSILWLPNGSHLNLSWIFIIIYNEYCSIDIFPFDIIIIVVIYRYR